MMSKQKRLKLHYVQWVDTTTRSSWVDIDKVNSKSHPATISHSVGWIVHEDKKNIILSPMINKLGRGSDVTTIPKQWVKQKTLIRGQDIIHNWED